MRPRAGRCCGTCSPQSETDIGETGEGTGWTGCLTGKTAGCDPHGPGLRSTDDPVPQARALASQARLAQPALTQGHGGGTIGLGFGYRDGRCGDASGQDRRPQLLVAYRATALVDWINPQDLAATVFILVFFGCSTLLGLGVGALLKSTLLRERLRLSTSNAFYAGLGLKGHPRLES